MKLFFVLGVLLLSQSITSSRLEEGQPTEREILGVIVVEECGKEINLTLHKYRDIFEPALKDFESEPPASESIQQKLQEIKDFNHHVDSLPENIDEKFLDEVFDLSKSLNRILAQYIYDNVKNNDDHLIYEKLHNNDLSTVLLNEMHYSGQCVQNARKRFTEWKSLPESERKLNPKVFKWYNDLVTAGGKNEKRVWILETIGSLL